MRENAAERQNVAGLVALLVELWCGSCAGWGGAELLCAKEQWQGLFGL